MERNPLKYKCELCGYEADHKSAFDRHKNKKVPCTINEDSKHKCSFCEKKFKTKRNLKRHEENTCPKQKEQAAKEGLMKHLVEKLSEKYDLEQIVKKDPNINNSSTISNSQIHSHNTTTTSQSYNTDNSVTNNITVYGYPLPVRSDGSPVQLNSFRSPNLDYVPQDVSILLPLEGNHLAQTIEKIYFNPLHPENHSIGHYDSKQKTCKVRTRDGFDFELIDDITIVVVQHLKTVCDATTKLVEMHPKIKSSLEKIFSTIDKAIHPQNEFYGVRNTLTLKVKGCDTNGIPTEKIDPDEIPPPSGTIAYDLWKVERAQSEIRTQLENRLDRIRDTSAVEDLKWNVGMVRGTIHHLDKLKDNIRDAPNVSAARKISDQVEAIKSSAGVYLDLLVDT